MFFDNSLFSLENYFQNTGLLYKIRFSSHYLDGKYFFVSLNPDTELTFEKIDLNEFLINGESKKQTDLKKIAEIISLVLSKQKLKHRLELYNSEGNEFDYYNFDWIK